MAKLKFKYLCRICGMKGFNKKVDLRNDCAHCEYSYVDDSNWDFFVEKGQTDGDTVLFDKLNIWQRILFIGEKKKKLLEKETGEKYQKIRDKIGYQDFLDNQSFLGKRGKIFSKNNQYLKYVSPNPQISLLEVNLVSKYQLQLLLIEQLSGSLEIMRNICKWKLET